jgi:phage terminase large subunit
MTAVRAYKAAQEGKGGVILCAREFMNSLSDSSMEEVKQAIKSVPWLDAFFDIGEQYIRTRDKKVSYVFCGLRQNLDSIKSKARVLIAWVDEAENVSDAAWKKLIPTVREDGSEIWVTWNPEKQGSPTDQRFRQEPPDGAKIAELNWQDNPWFPNVLRAEKDHLYRVDPEAAAHVWGGGYLQNSKSQVLHGKYSVQPFEVGEDWDGPYFGADWGFAQDPTTLVKCWIKGLKLYIEHEAYGVEVEIDQTPAMFDKVPGAKKATIRADCARPETISYMQRHGYGGVIACEKWSGSVEDGVATLRGFEEIVIHPRCKHSEEEARLWSYKTDRLTGDVLPDLVDKHNHIWDAVRYALGPIIKKSGFGLLDFMAQQAKGTT